MAAMQIRQEPMRHWESARVAARCEVPEFRRAGLGQNSVLPGLKIDVRQGIARRRGHVAPARLLC